MNKKLLIPVFVIASLMGCNRTTPSAEVPPASPTPVEFVGPVAPTVTGPVAQTPPGNSVKIDGKEIESPKGSAVTYKSTTTKTAKGVGASLRTDNAATAAGFNTGAPTTTFNGEDGGSASGGFSSANFKMTLPSGTSPLLWVGVLCFLGSGGTLYLGLKRAALFLGLFGAGFLAASAMSGAALFIVCGIAVLGGAAYIYAEHKGNHFFEAARATLGGIHTLDPAVKTVVDKAIADQSTKTDAKVILDLKAHDNIT